MKARVYCVLSLGLFCLSGWLMPTAAAPGGGNPGDCPPMFWGTGMCNDFCFSDRDCQGNKKCCFNGCGRECMAPYKPKPGDCPHIFGHGMCAQFCSNDKQCPGKEKCCFNGCGHQCMAPIKGN